MKPTFLFRRPAPWLHILLLALPLVCSASPCAAGQVSEPQVQTLPELMQIAVSGHPTVRAQQAALTSARSSVDAARYQYYPTPTLSAQHAQGRQATVLGLQQPLWTGGRLEAGVQAALARVEVADAALREARVEVASRVLTAWQSAVAAAARRQALGNGLERMRALQAMVERRLQTGLSGQVEMDLLQGRVSQAGSELAQAETDEQTALATLAQLTGQAVRLAAPAEPAADPRDTLAMVGDALSASPTLRRHEAEIESASRQVDLARAARLPTLYARVEFQSGSLSGVADAGPRATIGFEQAFGAGLGAAASVAVEGALAQRAAAQDGHEAAARDLTSRVTAEALTLQLMRAQVRAGEQGLQSLSAVAESYQRLFMAGKRSWLELLNTLREQTEAERSLYVARVQLAAAAYRLQLSTGDFAWMQ